MPKLKIKYLINCPKIRSTKGTEIINEEISLNECKQCNDFVTILKPFLPEKTSVKCRFEDAMKYRKKK